MKKIFILIFIFTLCSFAQQVYTINNGAAQIFTCGFVGPSYDQNGSALHGYGISLRASDNYLFWTDFTTGKILNSLPEAISVNEIISSPGAIFRGIALDQVRSYLFFSDNYSKSIYRSSYSGASQIPIKTGLSSPGHLQYNPVTEHLYYVDNGTDVKQIRRVRYDGSEDSLICTINMAFGFTVANELNKLFYVENSNNTLYSIDLNSRPFTKVSLATGMPSTIRGLFYHNASNRIIMMNAGVGMQYVDALTGTLTTMVPLSSLIGCGVVATGNNPLPVELTSFNVKFVNNLVTISFSTSNEVNNYGFDIERKTENSEWLKIGFVQGSGNSNSTKSYSFSDKKLSTNGKYIYRLKQIDNNGFSSYSNEISINISEFPESFTLYQNYPNPFNPATNFSFVLPSDGFVSLKIFNVIGQEVAVLINEKLLRGIHNITFNAASYISGTYYYTLYFNSEEKSLKLTKKMSLIK